MVYYSQIGIREKEPEVTIRICQNLTSTSRPIRMKLSLQSYNKIFYKHTILVFSFIDAILLILSTVCLLARNRSNYVQLQYNIYFSYKITFGTTHI